MLVSDHLCDRCQFHNLASPFMLSAAFIYLFIQDDFDPYRIVKQRRASKVCAYAQQGLLLETFAHKYVISTEISCTGSLSLFILMLFAAVYRSMNRITVNCGKDKAIAYYPDIGFCTCQVKTFFFVFV